MRAVLGRLDGPLLGAIFVVGASALWGTTGTVATLAPSVSPLAIGAVAMGVGGVLQALYAVQPIANHWGSLRVRWLLVSMGAAAVAVYPLAFYSSMHLSGVALGTVVSIGSAPLASAIIERLAEQKVLTRRWMLGALIGVAGAGLLCFAGDSAERPGALAEPWAVPAGIVLGLVAGVTYALYSWAAHRLIGGGVSSRAAMGAVFGLGGVLLMPVLAVTGRPLLESWGNFTVGAYMALVPMFAGYVLFGWGLARVRASTATGLSLMETVVAAVLAVVVVGERLPALGWLGVVMVLASLFVLVPRRPARQANAWFRGKFRLPVNVRSWLFRARGRR